MRWIWGILITVAIAPGAMAQEYVRPYDGIQAGLDSYHYHEAQRRANIDRQLGAIEDIRWWRGLPPRGFDPYRSDYAWRDSFAPYRGPGYFEIWGTTHDRYAPQPIGRREVQTGPNRWESHPIYVEPFRQDPPLIVPRSGPREF